MRQNIELVGRAEPESVAGAWALRESGANNTRARPAQPSTDTPQMAAGFKLIIARVWLAGQA